MFIAVVDVYCSRHETVFITICDAQKSNDAWKFFPLTKLCWDLFHHRDTVSVLKHLLKRLNRRDLRLMSQSEDLFWKTRRQEGSSAWHPRLNCACWPQIVVFGEKDLNFGLLMTRTGPYTGQEDKRCQGNCTAPFGRECLFSNLATSALRYLLDNPDECQGKTVLDVGSGCGASAIAAKLCGAAHVIANDIDKGMHPASCIFFRKYYKS